MYLEEDERVLEEVYPQGEKVRSTLAFIIELHHSARVQDLSLHTLSLQHYSTTKNFVQKYPVFIFVEVRFFIVSSVTLHFLSSPFYFFPEIGESTRLNDAICGSTVWAGRYIVGAHSPGILGWAFIWNHWVRIKLYSPGLFPYSEI